VKGFLWRVWGARQRYATICTVVKFIKLSMSNQISILLQTEKSQLRRFGHMTRMPHERLKGRVLHWLQLQESDPAEAGQGPSGVITSLSALVCSRWSLSHVAKIHEALSDLPQLFATATSQYEMRVWKSKNEGISGTWKQISGAILWPKNLII